MKHQRSTAMVALTVAASLAIAACGSDSDDDSSAPDDSTAPGGDAGDGATSLAGVCPDLISIQTDWMPEAEHGFIYQLIGDDYTIDASNAYVTGSLVDSDGNDYGVDIEIRSGGQPQQYSPPTQLLYQNEDILLGFVYTDEAIQFSGDFPTVGLMAGFEKNPQVIMWDPETYPDVEGVADLGELDVKVRYFGGAAYMDFLTGTGILSPSQVDGSYTGDPSLFIADEGASAQQAFGSAEPYLYEFELENWMKPVAYEYINDMGWRNYAQTIATRPENVTEYAECFETLVPLIQQASADYLADPSDTNALILAAVDAFGADFGWDYTAGAADFGVNAIRDEGLVANGPDGTLGSFDMDRVAELIELAVPVYEAQGASPKEGVTPEDIVTNQFIDPSIALP